MSKVNIIIVLMTTLQTPHLSMLLNSRNKPSLFVELANKPLTTSTQKCSQSVQ